MNEPFISVIITAHDRKKFIINAILSVLNQDLERENFEVLIVKNFNDARIDNFIETENLLSIYTDSISLGQKLALGIRKSKGEVISFLEDDDLWATNKLTTVMEQFKKDSSVGYYKNSIVYIDKEGNELPQQITSHFSDTLPASNKYNSYGVTTILQLLSVGAGYHLSSISIRRDIVLSFIDAIESTNVGQDLLMLFFALESKSVLLIDSRPLCLYRLHNSSSNDLQNYNSFIVSKQKLFSGALKTMLTLDDYCNLDSLKHVLSYIVANYKCYLALITMDDNITISERLRSLKLSIRVKDITGLLVLGLFIPKIGKGTRPLGNLFRYVYYLMLRKFYRSLGVI